MKLLDISPAGVLALIAALGTLPPTSALPKEPRNLQTSAASSAILVSKVVKAIPTGTQAISAVTSATQPGGAFWLRAVPKRLEHVPETNGKPFMIGSRSPTCVGAGCMDYNEICTEAGCTGDSGACEGAGCTPQISTGVQDALYCDDPSCAIVCRERLCIPYLGNIDGEGSSGPSVRDSQNERDSLGGRDTQDRHDSRDGRDGRDVRDGHVSRDDRDGATYVKRYEQPEVDRSGIWDWHTDFHSPFMIRDGKLYQDGGQLSTTGDVAFQMFKPSAHVSPIDTGFDIPDYLVWKNDALSKGEATFCKVGHTVYIVFTAKPDPHCVDVELEVLAQPMQGHE